MHYPEEPAPAWSAEHAEQARECRDRDKVARVRSKITIKTTNTEVLKIHVKKLSEDVNRDMSD